MCHEDDELTDAGLLQPAAAQIRLSDLVTNGMYPGNLVASPGQVCTASVAKLQMVFAASSHHAVALQGFKGQSRLVLHGRCMLPMRMLSSTLQV